MTRPAPTIAVLITYHEEGELLTQTLQSLLNEKSRPHEVIVYDDCSIDKKARDYIPLGYPVKLIEGRDNRGPAFSRNELAKAAISDYIHFQDSDDHFLPGWHERILSKLMEDDFDVVFTEVESYIENKLACAKVLEIEKVKTLQDLQEFSVSHILMTPAGTYRKSTFFNLGGYDVRFSQSEDYLFHVTLTQHAPKFAILYQPLIRLNLRVSSHSQSRINNAKATYQVLDLLSQQLPKNFHPLLGHRASISASEMYMRGELFIARKGFALADRLGCTFSQRNFFYRVIARTFGQEAGERVAELYRKWRKKPVTHAWFDSNRPSGQTKDDLIKKAS